MSESGADSWRVRLLLAVLVGAAGGYVWMFVASPHLQSSLTLLTGVFVVGTAGVLIRNRVRLTWRLVSSTVALGAVVHLAAAALVVAGDRLWSLGLVPALSTNWHHFLLGLLGISAAGFSWTRARGPHEARATPVVVHEEPEPPPASTPELAEPLDYDALSEELHDDPRRLRTMRSLQRIEAVLQGGGDRGQRLSEATRVVRQEALRLTADAQAEAREGDEGDLLSRAASLAEWGAQKLPELADLDLADLLMAKTVADIRSQHDRVEHRFVDLGQLRAIHPIDRPTAEEKARARADAARAALPVLRANGMRLSEELVAAHDELAAFRSVTGFQVVELADGTFVTFEGNGRREALQRALPDESVQIEVRVYCFDDPDTQATIQRRVQRVRRWMDVAV